MSIKITKRGTPPNEIPWSGTCSRCKSEMNWFLDDAKRYHAGDQRDSQPFTQIDCPVCGATVTGYN